MNARRVAAAEGVILAAMKNRVTAAGIAVALESACLLQSPESAAELVALRAWVESLEAERHSTNEALDDAVKALRVQRDRIAELETEPLAWAAELDAKSLDNFLGALGTFTEHEPQDKAVDRIHELLRSYREAAAAEDDREPDVDGAGRTYAEYYPAARPHPTAGALAEQRHLLDPLDHALEALAPHSTPTAGSAP